MSDEKIVEILKRAHAIKLDHAFDDITFGFLRDASMSVGVNFEFMITPLLTTVAHLMGTSTIRTLRSLTEGFVVYMGLVANPSTGKSPALSYFRRSLNNIEISIGTDIKDSKLVNGGTVEGLISLMESLKCVLSLWDESQSFLSSFGMYKGSSGSSYDRSIFLHLFDCPQVFRRDLKCSRTAIENARLNLLILGHPSTFIKTLEGEKNSKDDGLIQRFLIHAPKPIFFESDDIMKAPPNILSLTKVLYVVLKFHEKSPQYTLDCDAQELYFSVFSQYRKIVFDTTYSDTFISAMYGKGTTHVIRISGIIQAIKNAFEIVMKCEDPYSDKIDESFVKTIEDNLLEAHYSVEKNSVLRALNLVEYFNCHRLILAGYVSKNQEFPLQEVTEKVIQDVPKSQKQKSLSTKVLLMPGSVINLTECAQKNHVLISKVIEASELLEKDGLGTIDKSQGRNGKASRNFHKVEIESIGTDFQLCRKLSLHNVDVPEYIKAYNEKSTEKSSCAKRKMFNDEHDDVTCPKTRASGNSENNSFIKSDESIGSVSMEEFSPKKRLLFSNKNNESFDSQSESENEEISPNLKSHHSNNEAEDGKHKPNVLRDILVSNNCINLEKDLRLKNVSNSVSSSDHSQNKYKKAVSKRYPTSQIETHKNYRNDNRSHSTGGSLHELQSANKLDNRKCSSKPDVLKHFLMDQN